MDQVRSENPMSSVKSLFKSITERSKELLGRDITSASRKKRRERECRRRGVALNTEGSTEGCTTQIGELRIGASGKFEIGEQEFSIDEKTWIFGELTPGKRVQIILENLADGALRARKIVVK